MVSNIFSVVLAFAAVASAQNCSLQFNGRLPAGANPSSFDAKTSLFDSGSVFGKNLTWGSIIQIPAVTASLFDAKVGSIPFEVTISDQSIFAPSATNVQTGFRRAELLPASNNGSDPSTLGIKTLHFSLMKDAARPLNTSHEYQLVFVETADFSTNQFALKTGTISGLTGDPNQLVLQSNVRNATTLFATPFTAGTFHNFGLVLDFTKNTTQVLYSTGNTALAPVTGAVANDISGRGQFHFGMLKKPTGSNLKDITKEGFQPSNINEGIIYGGIFQEDSSTGCMTLQ
ncbi:hypothetical protein BP5796_05649 [Coleophoma crateriformis]|uniref:Glycoside hydrolase 131 catalytic N-terminal domain-containing protein n=1 Tax=Coleophoma crateriformis TaxID=565419 RepID=A0A3D8S4B9_9HELO|nr:hypothetical protein BP5796_05649 [Coleophoma crateriformis]